MFMHRIHGLAHRYEIEVAGHVLEIEVARAFRGRAAAPRVSLIGRDDAFTVGSEVDGQGKEWDRVDLKGPGAGPGPLRIWAGYERRNGGRLIVLIDAPAEWSIRKNPLPAAGGAIDGKTGATA